MIYGFTRLLVTSAVPLHSTTEVTGTRETAGWKSAPQFCGSAFLALLLGKADPLFLRMTVSRTNHMFPSLSTFNFPLAIVNYQLATALPTACCASISLSSQPSTSASGTRLSRSIASRTWVIPCSRVTVGWNSGMSLRSLALL